MKSFMIEVLVEGREEIEIKAPSREHAMEKARKLGRIPVGCREKDKQND